MTRNTTSTLNTRSGSMMDGMENAAVPTWVLDAAELSGGLLKVRYLEGGGSESDFRTDLSDAIAAALSVTNEWLADEADDNRKQ